MDDPDRKSPAYRAGCFVGVIGLVLLVAAAVFLLFVWDLDFSEWDY